MALQLAPTEAEAAAAAEVARAGPDGGYADAEGGETEERGARARAALLEARERGLELPDVGAADVNGDGEEPGPVGRGQFDGW